LFGLLTAWLLGARWWVLTLCAAAAVFCREQNIAVVLLLLAAGAWTRRCRVAVGMASVLAVWVAWGGGLRLTSRRWPFLPAQGNRASPLEGLLFRWTHLGHPTGGRILSFFHLVTMLDLALQFALVGYVIVSKGDRVVSLVALAGVALALLAGVSVYE